MILGMERFARKEIAIEYPLPVLTSLISMGEIGSGRRDRSAH